MSIQIAKAGNGDFSTVAALHRKGIAEGFLSTLGEPFLAVLYTGIAAVDQSGVLVAKEGEQLYGFLAYTGNVKGCYRRVLGAKWPSLAWTMLPNAFRLPLYRKIIETLRYPSIAAKQGKENGIPNASDRPPRPELLSVAVAESASGQGIGKQLVAATDNAMKRLGVDGYYVVTHSRDERSNRFYQSCGFKKSREFENHGKPMSEYYKRLD